MAVSWVFSFILLSVQMTNCLICRSVRIHNVAQGLKTLENCTVVEGFVQIILIQTNVTNHMHFEPFSYPRLREITEYLFVYHVWGLRSIGQLFPNLERIGGNVLFTQDSALVISECLQLEEIGLYSLKEITRGSVAVVRNPSETFFLLN